MRAGGAAPAILARADAGIFRDFLAEETRHVSVQSVFRVRNIQAGIIKFLNRRRMEHDMQRLCAAGRWSCDDWWCHVHDGALFRARAFAQQPCGYKHRRRYGKILNM